MFMNLERVVKGLWETRGEQREGGILEFIFFLFFFPFLSFLPIYTSIT